MPRKSSEKVNPKDWRNLPTDKWTVTTVRQYLADQHEAKYGIAYVTRSHAIEGHFIKSMIAEHGADIVRKFIDGCFAEYKPTRDYPGLSFAFMYSYQRARVLPRVLAAHRREGLAQAHEEATQDLADWL
jgi:hypothetical protein